MAPINCPHCERGQVQPEDPTLTRCPACGRAPEGWIVKMLEEITSLPDATGTHACEECGHPQMRRLPDETFWCPGCGQEILSLEATLALWEFRQEGEAFRRGWLDGYLLGEATNLSSSTQLVRGQGVHEERLEYYRGHRAGSQERFLLLGRAGLHSGSVSENVSILKGPRRERIRREGVRSCTAVTRHRTPRRP
jgi:ribosomal protein L37AE/L43A